MVCPNLTLRPVTIAPLMVLIPAEVSVPPTSTTPLQLVDPKIVSDPSTMRMPRPLVGSEKLPPEFVTRMTGQYDVSANEGHACAGTVTVGEMAFLLIMPSQSILTMSAAS